MSFKSALLAGTLALAIFPAAAQTEANGAARMFEPDYFAQFSPSTGLDMVRRIPGFSIQEDDDGSRGLGQADGNVLINGRRVSGKSLTLRDALARIPATNVEKIELVDGASLDIPGLSGQVVDVTAAVNGVSGTWEWRSRFRQHLPPFYDGANLSITGRTDALAWTLGLRNDPIRGGGSGDEAVYNGNRDLIEFREQVINRTGNAPGVSGSLEWTPANGPIANFNAEYNEFRIDTRIVSNRFPRDGRQDRIRIFDDREDEWNSEIGGDYEFGLGPGRLKTVALWRFEHSPFRQRVRTTLADGTLDERSIFHQTVDEGESILRSEYSWAPAEGRDWQIAAEGAFNFLEADAMFQTLDTGGGLVDVPLSNANSRVEENRIEFSVTHGRSLTSDISIQASIGAEYSELSRTGGASQTREFTRPKGYLSAAWAVDDKLTIN
ncbi:MAG: TonB-dependent receptor plug domain-containing protein, partial [Henriciella sp.]|uniref:TonB-dependent receptor plug domain-containing protein n=1 Tax=Henriciella sp. TaxID=1968823 RepID=UPI003C738618